ncbi:MAG: aminodeoxychorismate synthase component I [Cyclobacteriaceae bacterium]|nr:aminodeoxychorismate synthase component I [Cyclobacteriaceae bacterium]UYN87518.1 MAG: aminodeoxychorismate synthase component I [Cyclobacteriaceae bacterium]
MTINEFVRTLNQWGTDRVPFFFLIDFELQKPQAYRLDEIGSHEILYFFNGFSNGNDNPVKADKGILLKNKYPVDFSTYEQRFDKVIQHLRYGDSFLTNFTIKTKIELHLCLRDLFFTSKSKYKLWYKDQFLVFSPETFVQIHDQKIYSFPMKGTIDAHTANAREVILNDPKEMAEHITIVDLIRNDLSQVASDVNVMRFRFIEKIKTNQATLLQVSSEVVGNLTADYNERLGDILIALLPAGSVSGAPKPKTLEIIREAEGEERGYYTGVFGYFDGTNLDSGVMIRFIEKSGNDYVYRSGGGITTQSLAQAEYEEAIQKIYVPVN